MEVAPYSKAIRGWDGLDPAIEPCSANDENIALLGDSHDDINHLCGDDDDDDDSVVATAWGNGGVVGATTTVQQAGHAHSNLLHTLT